MHTLATGEDETEQIDFYFLTPVGDGVLDVPPHDRTGTVAHPPVGDGVLDVPPHDRTDTVAHSLQVRYQVTIC
jgi:hypothetical protein